MDHLVLTVSEWESNNNKSAYFDQNNFFSLNIAQLLKWSNYQFQPSSQSSVHMESNFLDHFHTRGLWSWVFAGHIFSWVHNHRPRPVVRRGPWRPETETESPGSRGPGTGVTLSPEPEPRGDPRPRVRKPGLRYKNTHCIEGADRGWRWRKWWWLLCFWRSHEDKSIKCSKNRKCLKYESHNSDNSSTNALR